MAGMANQPSESRRSTQHDGELLQDFILNGSSEAFAEILRRHERLVMSICRRTIGNSTDAEDAFQATFLTLARRPQSIRRAECLSSWLYGVAWRTSLQVNRIRHRDAVAELTTDPVGEDKDQLERITAARECVVLDEELHELPEHYRDVLILSHFSDQTNQQIADHLKLSKGAVAGRLRQARNALRVRLVRRGVGLGAVALAVEHWTNTPSASAGLIDTTSEFIDHPFADESELNSQMTRLEAYMKPAPRFLWSRSLVVGGTCLILGLGVASVSLLRSANADEDGIPQTVLGETSESSGNQKDNREILIPAILQPPKFDPRNVNGNTLRPQARSGPFTIGAVNDPPIEKWLHEMMDKPVPKLDFPDREIVASKFLDQLATHFSSTYPGPEGKRVSMSVYEDTAEFELEGINSLEDVTVHGPIDWEGLSLRAVLRLFFEKTTAPALSYHIHNECIVVSTLAKLESDSLLYTRAYRVGELANTIVTPHADEEDQPGLVDLLVEFTRPARWAHRDRERREGGLIRLVGDTLIVQQSESGHQQIVAFLNMLALAQEETAEASPAPVAPVFHPPITP